MRDDRASSSDPTSWVLSWHDAHPGATTRCFASGQDERGQSSYRRLAECVRPDSQVLELGAGDGYLLELLGERPMARLVGLDGSHGELLAASQRLEGHTVELVQAHAESLPFPEETFDHVVCHLALMLFSDVATALSEVARVLRPHGRMDAIVESSLAPDDPCAWQLLLRLMQRVRSSPPMHLGDSRVQELGWTGIAQPHALVEVSFVLEFPAMTPEGAWRFFTSSYNESLLTTAELAWLRHSYRALVERLLREDGTVPFRLGLRHLTMTLTPPTHET